MKPDEAFNRLSREVKRALPYYEKHGLKFKGANESDVMDLITRKMMYGDAETEEAIKNLVESIINEHDIEEALKPFTRAWYDQLQCRCGMMAYEAQEDRTKWVYDRAVMLNAYIDERINRQ